MVVVSNCVFFGFIRLANHFCKRELFGPVYLYVVLGKNAESFMACFGCDKTLFFWGRTIEKFPL